MKNDTSIVNAILTRRSIRKLKPDPLPEVHINTLMDCVEAAPNAGNLQPWNFIIVKKQEVKDELCRLSFNQESVRQAPVVFVVCARPAVSAEKYGTVGQDLFCIQDTAAAVQNLLLAAHGLGYGAVWIGVINEKDIATCLGLAADQKPVAIIPVGIPDEGPPKMERVGWRKVTRMIE